MKRPRLIPFAVYEKYLDNDKGICRVCFAMREEDTDADTDGYYCENCGQETACGMQFALNNDIIEIEDKEEVQKECNEIKISPSTSVSDSYCSFYINPQTLAIEDINGAKHIPLKERKALAHYLLSL